MSLAAASFRREIVLCGDSITQYGFNAKGSTGWASIIADAYQRKADVINRGYSGYTTRTATPVFERVFAAAKAAGTRFCFATVFLGANDANQDAGLRKPAQHVPVDEYETRLASLLKLASDVSDAVVCIAPPPVDKRRWPSRGNSHVAAYTAAAERAVEAARAHAAAASSFAQLVFVPLQRLMGAQPELDVVPGDREDSFPWLAYLNDGLHLSAAGNAFVADAVLRAVARHAPHCAAAALPLDYPLFGDIAQGSGEEAREALTSEALAAFHAAQAAQAEAGMRQVAAGLRDQAAELIAQAKELESAAADAEQAVRN